MHTTYAAILLGSTLMTLPAQTLLCPELTLTNGHLTAKLYLPDAEKGYYRGTRFDWAGQIHSLRTAHHEYFGQWFPHYDARLHDAIMGPVEEFVYQDKALGWDEAKPGETFVRIGVGVLHKPATGDGKFNRFAYYEIVDAGRRTMRHGSDFVTFTHEIKGPNGYAYHYTKTLRLHGDSLTIEHRLRNTGTREIVTSQYNHNFFVLDGQPTGPLAHVEFPFTLEATQPLQGNVLTVEGGRIGYTHEIEAGQSAFTEFKGTPRPSDYDIRVEHAGAGAGVRIRGFQPITRIVYWSIRSTFCPEAYVDFHIRPGAEAVWRYEYDFYDLKETGAR